MPRAHVFFTGNVQGVGFRFTAQRLADACGITGRVRNIPGGGVELIADHRSRSEIAGFIAQLTAQFGCQANASWSEPSDPYADFAVGYGFGCL